MAVLDRSFHPSFHRGSRISYTGANNYGGKVVKNRYYDIYLGDSTTPAYPCICLLEVIPNPGFMKFRIKQLDGKERVVSNNNGQELIFNEVSPPTIPVFRSGEKFLFSKKDLNSAKLLLQKLVPNKLYEVKQPKRSVNGTYIFLSGKVKDDNVILDFMGLNLDILNGDVTLIAQNG